MEAILDALIARLERLKRLDWNRFHTEGEELGQHVLRQVFNQIPAVSGAVGLVSGAWVASTFTDSPWKAQAARWGLVKGGKHVVSSGTYKFLSVCLPILSVAVTAYLVQRGLRWYRHRELEADMRRVAGLGPDVQAAVRERLAVLDRAVELGLLSQSEYLNKKVSLYAEYSRVLPAAMRQFIASKLT